MAEQNPTTFSNGSPPTTPEPRKSLREIAEASYDEVEAGVDAGADGSPVDDSSQAVDDQGQTRDARGRFVSREGEPGEAEPAQESSPSPDQPIPGTPPPEQPHPAPEGSSSEAPANWSAEDRQLFAELPQKGRTFLLRRHSEMEGDYQRKVSAYGAAAQFAESLSPVFTDPVVAGSLERSGVSPQEAILQWGGFHRRAMDPNPAVRSALLGELAQRMGLNPAAASQPTPPLPPGVSPEDMKDPAIKFFADQISQALNGQAELRNELQTIRQQEQQTAQAQTLRVTRWGIDNFADEKGPDGRPLRPYFDRVLPQVIELFRADPNRDLNQAYQTAMWMNPEIRAEIQRAETARAAQATSNQRAAQAARLNTRGRTAPVSAPNGAGEGPKTLRETIEASADEVGF